MLIFRVVALLIFTLVLAACSSQPSKVETSQSMPAGDDSALSAIEALIANYRWVDAEESLQDIEFFTLSKLEQIQFQWLKAKLSIALGRGDQALTALNAVTPGDFLRLNNISTHEPGFLRATALHLKGQYIASARERMFLSGTLEDDDEYLKNHEATWSSLMQASDVQIEALSQKSSTAIFKGWLDLALIIKRTQIDLDRQLSALRKWQVRYNNHPAAKQLPGGLEELEDYVDNKAKYVALMLPLTGKLASTGKALRDGFFAAYYQAQKAGAEVPEVKVYDTAKSRDFWSLYKKAILDGNELVIGPLEKPAVERLQQEERLPVPTLALNYGVRDARENPEQLFQFGLAVEDEAEIMARYARQQGYKRAVALMPKGPWGERVFNRFSQTWQAQGGELIEAQFFDGKGDYNKVISHLFAVNDSERRARALRRQLGTPLEFQARRREDVDFIFVAALPKQARQIKPTLAFNFAKNIPMLATSQIYKGVKSRTKDRDLEDVVFCDIPWILDKDPLRKDIQSLWPKSHSSLDRLFALGIDAFQVYPRLGQIKVLNYSSIQGKTGQLALDQYGQIIRSLPFAVFKKGVATKTQKAYSMNSAPQEHSTPNP